MLGLTKLPISGSTFISIYLSIKLVMNPGSERHCIVAHARYNAISSVHSCVKSLVSVLCAAVIEMSVHVTFCTL